MCKSLGEALIYTVYQEAFEGESFCEFQGLVAIHETFLCKIWGHRKWTLNTEPYMVIHVQLNSFSLTLGSSNHSYPEVSSNCSRECSDGFYLHQQLGSCRPLCEFTSTTSSAVTVITLILICCGLISAAVILVVSVLQWKQM